MIGNRQKSPHNRYGFWPGNPIYDAWEVGADARDKVLDAGKEWYEEWFGDEPRGTVPDEPRPAAPGAPRQPVDPAQPPAPYQPPGMPEPERKTDWIGIGAIGLGVAGLGLAWYLSK